MKVEIELFGKITYHRTNVGWLIISRDKEYNYKYDEDNYLAFLELLKLSNEHLDSLFHEVIKKDGRETIYNVFPFYPVLLTTVSMKSNYWLELILDLIIYCGIRDLKILHFFDQMKIDDYKWIDLKLFHKAKKFLRGYDITVK